MFCFFSFWSYTFAKLRLQIGLNSPASPLYAEWRQQMWIWAENGWIVHPPEKPIKRSKYSNQYLCNKMHMFLAQNFLRIPNATFFALSPHSNATFSFLLRCVGLPSIASQKMASYFFAIFCHKTPKNWKCEINFENRR